MMGYATDGVPEGRDNDSFIHGNNMSMQLRPAVLHRLDQPEVFIIHFFEGEPFVGQSVFEELVELVLSYYHGIAPFWGDLIDGTVYNKRTQCHETVAQKSMIHGTTSERVKTGRRNNRRGLSTKKLVSVSRFAQTDNDSTDKTVERAKHSGATVLHESRRGYGYACLKGIDHLQKHRTDIVVFLDGDFSDFPEDMPDLLQPILHDGYDLVIGSRMLGEREPGALLPQAILGNWLASTLIRLFWGQRFTDLGPFRAIRTDALKRLKMSDPTYGWTVEMQIKAAKLKMRCSEVHVRYRKRIGRSKVTGTLSGTIKASAKILFTIFKYVFVKV